jgi:uncharacterized membrane protein HdeD (DUF308 family)
MSNQFDSHSLSQFWLRIRPALGVVLGCLAIAAPFVAGPFALPIVGGLLIVCGVLEMFEAFQADEESGRTASYFSGALSVGAGILLYAKPQLVLRGLSIFVGGSFLLGGLGTLWSHARQSGRDNENKLALGSGILNLLLGLMLITRWPVSGVAMVEILVGVHILAVNWSRFRRHPAQPVTDRAAVSGAHPDSRLGLAPHAEFRRLNELQIAEEEDRWWIDTYWCFLFALIFFAIHIGRMKVEWNLVGMLSPLAAVVGDIGTALLISFGLLLPLRLAWRRVTRPLEIRGWRRLLARLDQSRGPGVVGYLSRRWLLARMRFARQMSRVRQSPISALQWALRVGLPLTAILIAINPIWGFSWFFNSESWATEVWHRWAEARTDTWRQNMIETTWAHFRNSSIAEDQLFQVKPDGVEESGDFSFLVLGDTGEGDASQHCLRDQFLFLGQRPDIKFLVVSSDVIYPAGAMSDYEGNFYLPFKGFTKPIYAIPGNHDWYDALEAFSANFLQADAARVSMHSRVVTDKRLTTTTDSRIDGLIREADRLRQEFGVSTGWQRGPFFELQTPMFSLLAVDTGVMRTVDSREWQWLNEALERARGKFTMAILGHPLYAGGRYQGGEPQQADGEWVPRSEVPNLVDKLGPKVESFHALHQLLRDHGVQVVMAGDTHYFEHYIEQFGSAGQPRTMNHFVNGGGGAYISIGTPLDWPAKPDVPDCAFFPRTDFLVNKLEREMPLWKTPLWFWVKRLRAWPFTAEAVAGAFDYNKAPYLQSFVEVRVERSARRVRVIVHGANGPLHWRDLQVFGSVRPPDKSDADVVEFVLPIR